MRPTAAHNQLPPNGRGVLSQFGGQKVLIKGFGRALLPPETLRRVSFVSLPGLQWCPAAGDIDISSAFTFPESGLYRAC